MNKILFLIIFSSIGFVGSGQISYNDQSRNETIVNIIRQIDIGPNNGIKNTALDAGIIGIQLFRAIKILKNANSGHYKFSRPVAPDPFIIPFNLSTGLALNLRK